jgi:hypothetical protein
MSQDIGGVRERVTQELHKLELPSQGDGVSQLAMAGDPSVGSCQTVSARRGSSGVEWVRASDVLQSRGARFAGRHAQGQENLVRRMRHGMAAAVSRRGAGRQAVSLPAVSSFGHAVPAVSGQAVGR